METRKDRRGAVVAYLKSHYSRVADRNHYKLERKPMPRPGLDSGIFQIQTSTLPQSA
jgi:hypothetical protein